MLRRAGARGETSAFSLKMLRRRFFFSSADTPNLGALGVGVQGSGFMVGHKKDNRPPETRCAPVAGLSGTWRDGDMLGLGVEVQGVGFGV